MNQAAAGQGAIEVARRRYAPLPPGDSRFLGPAGQMIVQTVTMKVDRVPSPSVMVVAADADVLTAVERGLRLSGFDTLCARNSEKASVLLRQARPTAIVVDVGQPLSRGTEVVTALRAIDGATPVCVLTDESALANLFPGLDEGADDFIVKPFGLGDLVSRVKALLQRAAKTSRHRQRQSPLVILPSTFRPATFPSVGWRPNCQNVSLIC
jgi:FixJ family two-component response regulator